MTTPNVTAPLAASSIEAAMAAVREGGLRLSSARRLVLEALFRAKRPVSAEEIADGIGGVPPSDVASVYRNLETLERVGLIRHVHLGHGAGLYALAGREGDEYLVCESCGNAQAIDPADLEVVRTAIHERLDFEPRFSHFPLFGVCAACARQRVAEAPEMGVPERAADQTQEAGAREQAAAQTREAGAYAHPTEGG